ncbi:hypothetical protein Tco_0734337, partial [Tanacetum coccineum]
SVGVLTVTTHKNLTSKEVAKVRGRDVYVNESTVTGALALPATTCVYHIVEEATKVESSDVGYLEMTSAITSEGLYDGLDRLCKQISFICAITGEGVTRGLNWLRNSSANKDIYPDRVGRVDLLDRHPAAVIRDSIHSGHLLPCMLGTCKYYLYYYKVPNEAEYTVGYGYHQIQDHSKGV